MPSDAKCRIHKRIIRHPTHSVERERRESVQKERERNVVFIDIKARDNDNEHIGIFFSYKTLILVPSFSHFVGSGSIVVALIVFVHSVYVYIMLRRSRPHIYGVYCGRECLLYFLLPLLVCAPLGARFAECLRTKWRTQLLVMTGGALYFICFFFFVEYKYDTRETYELTTRPRIRNE